MQVLGGPVGVGDHWSQHPWTIQAWTPGVGFPKTPGRGLMDLEVWEAEGWGWTTPFSRLLCSLPHHGVPRAPLQVFLTATHSHSSPFDVLEGYICPVLFGAAWGGDHHHDNHGAPHGGGGGLGTQHSGLPAKAREELSEGSRKKKTKKAD